MAKYKVAINGFGRIGRLSLRSMFMNPNAEHEFEIVAINSRTPADSPSRIFLSMIRSTAGSPVMFRRKKMQ